MLKILILHSFAFASLFLLSGCVEIDPTSPAPPRILTPWEKIKEDQETDKILKQQAEEELQVKKKETMGCLGMEVAEARRHMEAQGFVCSEIIHTFPEPRGHAGNYPDATYDNFFNKPDSKGITDHILCIKTTSGKISDLIIQDVSTCHNSEIRLTDKNEIESVRMGMPYKDACLALESRGYNLRSINYISCESSVNNTHAVLKLIIIDGKVTGVLDELSGYLE